MKGGIDMKNKIGLIKVLGMVLTIGGTIASSWSGEKEQKETSPSKGLYGTTGLAGSF